MPLFVIPTVLSTALSASSAGCPAETALTPSEAAQRLAGAALAPATIRAYRAALAGLETWLSQRGRALSDASIADYLAARHEAGLAPSTIALTVAAVKAAAKLVGHPAPVGKQTARVLAGIRREGRSRGRGQVQGLRWAEADTVATFAANSGGKLTGLRDAAIVALASDCLLRVSEIVAVQITDLEAEADGSGRLTVHRSKTDQEGEGAELFVGQPTMRRIPEACMTVRCFDAFAAAGRPCIRSDHGSHRPCHYPAARRRSRYRGARVWSFVPRGVRAMPGRRRGRLGRNAGCRALAVAVNARPLC